MFNVGSVFFGANTNNGGGGGVSAVLANQGLSIDPGSLPTAPVVQWGDAIDGSASRVIGKRYMDLQRGEMFFLNIGDPAFGLPALGFQEAPGRIFGSNPFQTFFSSAGNEIGRINFGDGGGVYIGAFAAQNETRAGEIAIGRNVFRNFPTGGSNIGIGADVMSDSATISSRNVGLGNGVMAGFSASPADSVGVGTNSLLGAQGTGNVGMGTGSGQGLAQGSFNVFIGQNTGFKGAGAGANSDGNTFVGGRIQELPNTPFGIFNTIIGSYNVQNVELGDYNILMGWANNFTATTNSTCIGNAFSSILSNVAFFGNPDQNMIIGGARSGQADSGVKMQVIGDLSTIDPDTGLSGSGWELGTFQPGAVVMDAANFISVKIGGVAYKLLVAA